MVRMTIDHDDDNDDGDDDDDEDDDDGDGGWGGATAAVVSAQIRENIKAPRHWPLCGEFTGDRWITRTNGQLRGKCFYLMTLSWERVMII